MLTTLKRRPSLAVAAWAIVVLALFVWRGDLGVAGWHASPDRVEAAADSRFHSEEPVVVRRREATAPADNGRVPRRGRVFDSMGFLLVGAEIVPDEGVSRRTDAEGAFLLDLDPHRVVDVLVRAQGRRSQWLRTSAGSPDPLVTCMEPSAPWDAQPQPPAAPLRLRGEGLVCDTEGKPLENALVNVLGSDCWGRTNDIGRYEVPLPSPSVTFLVLRPAVADGSGALASVSEPFVATRVRGAVPLPDLIAEPGGSIRGVVRDANGGPIAGLPIQVRGAGVRRVVETSPGGAFVLSGLLPADYEVAAFAYRGSLGEAQSVRVDRQVVACELQLSRVDEAQLRVVDESGDAAGGVWVAANLFGQRRGVAQANADGLVRLPITVGSEFEVRSADGFVDCVVREFDAAAAPARLIVSQP